MSELNLVIVLLAVVMLVVLATAVRRFVRVRTRRRVVEQPNSHYTPQGVLAAEARHRWQSIAMDRIHEINREEVVRLLAKVEAIGVDALRDNERAFLDYVTELASAPVRPEPPDPRRLMRQDLQHRPA